MTQLEIAFETVINVFHQYSVLKPHPDKLSKGETKQLMEKELPEFLKKQVNPKGIEELFKDLDTNKDQDITFKEFMGMATQVLIATHTNLHNE
nr:protein S100-A12-like [Pogona vitticeps]